MCGRAACSLSPDGVCQVCSQKISDFQPKPPNVVYDHYSPSYNLCPTNYGLVLLRANHLSDSDKNRKCKEDIVLFEMKWGLIPSWTKCKEPINSSYKMINARADTLLEKRTFKKLLDEGRRCVFVVEGFYEWRQLKNGKQPYFIQIDSTQNPSEQKIKTEVSGIDSKDVKLLFIAALFDVNFHLEDQPIYSFTVITVPASDSIKFVHDRMPAILPNEQSILKWLDNEQISTKDALKLLQPFNELKYYPVSKSVNNVSYKEADCIKPLPDVQEKSIVKFFTKSKIPVEENAIESQKNIKRRKLIR